MTKLERNAIEDGADAAMLSYWDARRDTKDIARLLGITEAQVANRLPRLLDRRRAVKMVMARRALRVVEKRVEVKPVKDRGLLIA